MLARIAAAADLSLIKFDHEDLDKYIEKGNDIDKTVLMTSFDEMKDWRRVKTKHGLLEVKYSSVLPPNTMWLIKTNSWGYTPWKYQ
jgi:hypothetical protein